MEREGWLNPPQSNMLLGEMTIAPIPKEFPLCRGSQAENDSTALGCPVSGLDSALCMPGRGVAKGQVNSLRKSWRRAQLSNRALKDGGNILANLGEKDMPEFMGSPGSLG